MLKIQPPLEFIPPNLNLGVVQLTHLILPYLMKTTTDIQSVTATNIDTLITLYEQFQNQKIRLILAFRHPSTNDPYSMLYLLSHILPQSAQKQGIKLKKPVHTHFMYDRGIPLWAGEWVKWLFPRLGGTSIQRGKVDRLGLKSARELLLKGQYPLTIAPEGSTNGHNQRISPLEPGIAQLAFWCKEDLVQNNRNEDVYILPIGLQYHYQSPPWNNIQNLFTLIEEDLGINNKNKPDEYYARLVEIANQFLGIIEQFYREYYHQELPPLNNTITLTWNEQFSFRLQQLLDVALQVAETYFGLTPKGTVIDRCRKIEQAGWDCIYREETKNKTLSPVEKGLFDRVAGEAELRLLHMRMVENFVAVSGSYVRDNPTAERFADTLLQIWYAIQQIKGDFVTKRPSLGSKIAKITIGEPISINQKWESYSSNRKMAKQAVLDITQTLQTALENMIIYS